MLTTIKGVYDQGKIILMEEPKIKTKTTVIVTFLKEEKLKPLKKNQVRLGGLEGKIKISDDFDEPLDELKDYM